MADGQTNFTVEGEVAQFIERCADIVKTPCSAEQAPKYRALQGEEVALRKKLDATRTTEKEPHLRAGQAVDAKYNPLIAQVKKAVEAVTAALTVFLEAEDARIREEARLAREQAEKLEREAAERAAEAEAEDDPFEAFDKGEVARQVEAQAASLARQAAAPVKAVVASADGGRAGGLRTVGWNVEIIDASALVAHYAHRSEFLDLAEKMAKAEAKATKGQCKIPGVRVTADRRAA